MPLGDWQFYVVTAAAVGGVWLIVRPFIARRRKRRGVRTPLTVRGERT